jgi:hypothetical protein
VIRRRGRRRKKLLDDLKDRRGYSHLKEKWVPGIFPGGKDGWSIRLTTLPPLCADYLYLAGSIQIPAAAWRGSAAAGMLGVRVRISPGAWMFVSCECCVLSGRCLRDGPIPRPEESTECGGSECDHETLPMRMRWPTRVAEPKICRKWWLGNKLYVSCSPLSDKKARSTRVYPKYSGLKL